jgi:hypothetical protein
MTIGKQLSDGNPDGTGLGQSSTDKISVYGVDPVVQATAPTAVSASSVVQVSAGGFGFETSTQGNALVTAVNSMRTALVNFGIMTSA